MGKTPMVLSMGKESWKDWDVKGRATFRPPASEVGRPVFHPDAEEAEVLLRRLKRDVRKAEEERDLAKVGGGKVGGTQGGWARGSRDRRLCRAEAQGCRERSRVRWTCVVELGR